MYQATECKNITGEVILHKISKMVPNSCVYVEVCVCVCVCGGNWQSKPFILQ